MDIVIGPYTDPGDGLEWHEQTPIIMENLHSLFDENNDKYNFKAIESNHGLGADWPTITIQISSLVGTFILIPELHKLVRESLDEWKTIGEELTSVIAWLATKYPIESYPKELLFFDMLEWLEVEYDIDARNLELVDVDEDFPITEKRHGLDIDKSYLFTLKTENTIYQIAIKNNREVVWHNSYKI